VLTIDFHPDNQGSDTRRGMSIVLINLIGQCGPFLGTNVFPLEEQPRYVKGMSICAAFMFFSAVIAIAQRGLLAWENSRLDRKYGAVSRDRNGVSDAKAAENYGPNFRYVL
jgi:hypothetical protein